MFSLSFDALLRCSRSETNTGIFYKCQNANWSSLREEKVFDFADVVLSTALWEAPNNGCLLSMLFSCKQRRHVSSSQQLIRRQRTCLLSHPSFDAKRTHEAANYCGHWCSMAFPLFSHYILFLFTWKVLPFFRFLLYFSFALVSYVRSQIM